MKNKNSLPFLIIKIITTSIIVFWIISVATLANTIKTKTVTYIFSAKETSIANKTGIIVLKGEAKVRKNGNYLNADQITIYKDIKTGEIIRMEAAGNVDMNEDGKKTTCKKAIFYESEGRIEMEGTEDSPVVVDDGKNKLVAPVISYFREEDRLEAKGNVTGHVIIEEKEKQETPAGEKSKD